jgi:hypothetical protein
LILDFLRNKAKVSASSQAIMISEIYFGYDQRMPWQMTGIYLVAYFGLSKLIILALLKHRHNPNIKDTYGQTLLIIGSF